MRPYFQQRENTTVSHRIVADLRRVWLQKTVPILTITVVATLVLFWGASFTAILAHDEKKHYHQNHRQLAFSSAATALDVSLDVVEVLRRNDQTTTTSQKSPSASLPIFVLGLPRSGSDSLHRFFECMGLSSSHYCCDTQKTKKKDLEERLSATKFPCPKGTVTCGSCLHANLLLQQQEPSRRPSQGALDVCGDYQVYARIDVESADPFAYFLPQHFALPLLHEHYPDATWILNTRHTPEQWAINVQHWYSVTRRFLNSFDVPYHSELDDHSITTSLLPTLLGTDKQKKTKQLSSLLYAEVERSLQRVHNVTEHERRKQALVDIYQRHTLKVQEFCSATTGGAANRDHHHHLVTLSVDDANAGTILAEALHFNVTLAKTCWNFDAPALDNDWKNLSFNL